MTKNSKPGFKNQKKNRLKVLLPVLPAIAGIIIAMVIYTVWNYIKGINFFVQGPPISFYIYALIIVILIITAASDKRKRDENFLKETN